jgi:uncharacterized membrane protein HdeD (DUF308 family)
MTRRRWWTARQIATGVGVLAALVGVLVIIDPFDNLSSGTAITVGVALIAIGAYISVRSAWIARRNPDDTPWNPMLDGDLTGGL